jgi:hypothetical protein
MFSNGLTDSFIHKFHWLTIIIQCFLQQIQILFMKFQTRQMHRKKKLSVV